MENMIAKNKIEMTILGPKSVIGKSKVITIVMDENKISRTVFLLVKMPKIRYNSIRRRKLIMTIPIASEIAAPNAANFGIRIMYKIKLIANPIDRIVTLIFCLFAINNTLNI